MVHLKKFFRYIKDYSKYVDFTLLIAYIALCFIGLVMIYSASMVAGPRGMLSAGEPVASTHFYKRQLFVVILGFILVFVMSFFISIKVLNNKGIQKIAIMSILMLLILIYTPLGKEVNGSRSWLNLGMQIQPSEFLKIVTIVYLSYIYSRKKDLSKMSVDLFAPLILIGFCTGLVMLQPDLGSTLLNMSIILCIFVYAGIAIRPMIISFSIIGAAVVALLAFMKVTTGNFLLAHQAQRFEVLANPFKDESGAGYQLTNSLMAIGNGGFFGRGLGNGIMKLGYLPEPHTDFIFAVISEELGFIGVIVVIFLIYFIVYKGFLYAALTDKVLYRLICVGVASYIGIQAFVNLGGVVGLIPLTGVPLPFLSYGGSSMLSLSIAVGLLLMTSKHVKQEQEQKKMN